MDNSNDILFENQKIVDIQMEKEVKQSFIDYSMSVIVSRALPDARDGLKPGQRRILYAMHEDHLTYDKPFRKSATTVGNVLGRYHPHGDTAVYNTMVRMAQPFSLRYPLVQGHGNFGNVDGDGAAAYRYTEARLSRLSDELMRDLDKEVVRFQPNFDNRLREPTVLPSRFPNLLVNGSVGIAVGMATYIPPHNLGEVIDATIYRMENPGCGLPDLLELIKGPDFPTSATICGTAGIVGAYATGRGRIIVRARAEVEENHRRIIVTEIPYQVNKSMLVESIADLVRDKRVEGITEIRDESGRGGMRIVIEHKRDANGQIILNQLYKFTQLQDTCAVNMVALVGGEPKTLNLTQLLDCYITHQESVITNRTRYELERAKREAHIYEGYKIAIDNIDEIIDLIKNSASIPDSRANLIARYSFTEEQAQAIVDMTLGRLSGLERQKIEERLEKLAVRIAELEEILGDPSKVREIIKEELLEIRRRFADERRTDIVPLEDEIMLEDLIDPHDCVVSITHAGYIKRQPASTYSAQRRGGRGITGIPAREEDFIKDVIVVHSHSYLLMFTNTGRVYIKKAYQIPEASRTARGTNIVNILELSEGEKITTVISVADFSEEEYLTMVTRRGIIKRTPLSEYEFSRRAGKIALTLDDGDELVFVMRTRGDLDIIIATSQGYCVRFTEENVRVMGRGARGVRGVRLSEGDYVAGVAAIPAGSSDDGCGTGDDDVLDDDNNNNGNDDEIIVDSDSTAGVEPVGETGGEGELSAGEPAGGIQTLITVTAGGYAKRTDFNEFRAMKNRGGSGVICHRISEKTGRLAGIATVCEDEDLMLITNGGIIIRTPVNGIPKYSRGASGVIAMRLTDGAEIVNFTKVKDQNVDM